MIIVTGSSKGIGNAIANRLSKNGHEVLGISRTLPKDESSFKTYQGDVSQKESLIKLQNELKENNITVTGLINAAGILENVLVDWMAKEQSEIEEVFNTNVVGVINSCQTFIPLMNKKEHTPIINIASISAHVQTDLMIYGPSKYAIYGFTKNLARSLKNTSIRPNCISPGPIFPTGMTEAVPGVLLKHYASSQIINGKIFSPEDICDVVELLLDPKSNSLTGQSFHIGGI
jgi:3-oxoacyl-[acyl-carrier protein] reductase